MYKYRNFKLPGGGTLTDILRLADGAAIPVFPGNRDYDECMAWVADGNTIAPADPFPSPTQEDLDIATCKSYQKLTAIAAMTPDQAAAWVQANVVDLPTAKDLLKTMAMIMTILVRRTLK